MHSGSGKTNPDFHCDKLKFRKMKKAVPWVGESLVLMRFLAVLRASEGLTHEQSLLH